MFHVGQLVICVNDEDMDVPCLVPGGAWREWDAEGLTKGRVYTIRDVIPRWTISGLPCVRLVEIARRRGGDDPDEPPFGAVRFRPIDDTKIEVFRKALRTLPVDDLETVE